VTFRVYAVCLSAALLLSACPKSRHAAPPPHAEPSRPEEMPTSGDDTAERTSLGSLASGACVIDRTGEDTLGVSALSAIDGNPDSGWVGPAQDLPQSLTVGLPVRTRVTSIGLRSTMKKPFRLRDARVEAANGNGPFATIATVTLKDSGGANVPLIWSVGCPIASAKRRAAEVPLAASLFELCSGESWCGWTK